GLLIFLAAPAEVTPVDSLDPTRPLGTAVFDGPADLLAEGAEARTVLGAGERTALLLLAADAVGVAAAATGLAVEHAKTRHQFGRAIGSFQAVAHRCADMFVAVESARALVAAAASACDEEDPDAGTAVALAAANALEAAVTATQGGIQVHGGMGFTWEHASHRHLRRAKAAEALIAFPDRLRDRAATSLLTTR
ncbi:acyl-CoA dehydrogenase family protein, partial [Actinocorallia aurantiaca]